MKLIETNDEITILYFTMKSKQKENTNIQHGHITINIVKTDNFRERIWQDKFLDETAISWLCCNIKVYKISRTWGFYKSTKRQAE